MHHPHPYATQSSMLNASPFFVTTPIYYVNDKPHIGHAYTTIAADVVARTLRLEGRQVLFLTGTDEHGQKVEQAAAKAGISPQEFTDRVSQNFRDLALRLNISNDQFIRTTEPRHKAACQALWQRLADNGHIYLGKYAGWYAIRDEAYYQENELVDGKAPTGAPVEWVEEPSYFFRLSAFGDKLLKFYEDNPDFIAPASRRNEVLRFVEGGLKDLSISRTTFRWGVPVPGDERHIMYVWLDALTNYLTAVGFPEKTSDYATFWPASLHLMGKDIVRFHAVYWPAFLMAAGLPVCRRVFAHGWWTNNGEKISKSLGNVIDPLAIVDRYSVDAFRYFLLREVSFGSDGDFSEAALQRRLHGELADAFGNLAQRVIAFIWKNLGGKVPISGIRTTDDVALLTQVRALPEIMRETAENQNFHKGLESFMTVVTAANVYIDHTAPWSLRKTDPARMATVLVTLLETLRGLAIAMQPVIPTLSGAMLDQLAIPATERLFIHANSDFYQEQSIILQQPTPLVQKIEI